jgi:hypothetical protein
MGNQKPALVGEWRREAAGWEYERENLLSASPWQALTTYRRHLI